MTLTRVRSHAVLDNLFEKIRKFYEIFEES